MVGYTKLETDVGEMNGSINKTLIIGRLSKKPDMQYPRNGTSAVCRMTVETTDRWTDRRSGEKRQRKDLHRVVAFGRLAEVCGRLLKKGSQVCVQGAIQTRKWTDEVGQEHYMTEIKCAGHGDITFLGAQQGINISGVSTERNQWPAE